MLNLLIHIFLKNLQKILKIYERFRKKNSSVFLFALMICFIHIISANYSVKRSNSDSFCEVNPRHQVYCIFKNDLKKR